MKQTYLPGEVQISLRHQHWIALAPAGIRSFFILLLGIAGALVLVFTHHATLAWMPAVALAILALAIFSGDYVTWRANTFTLTNHRVILSVGIFSIATRIIPLDRIQNVNTSQTFTGRLLDYGRIEIDAAGTQGAERLELMAKPMEFRDLVFAEIEKYHAEHGTSRPDGL